MRLLCASDLRGTVLLDSHPVGGLRRGRNGVT